MVTRQTSAKRAALIAATLSSFLTPFMAAALNVALPAIGREFSMDALLLGWVPTSYLLAAAIFLVPFGKLADVHGRKRVFAYGIGLYSLASLLCGMTPSASWLVAARVLQGIGGAMIFGTGVAILTSVFGAEERGRVLGLNTAAVYIGLSVGPTIGGLLTQHAGWRSIFLANVPLGLIAIAFVLLYLRGEWADGENKRFDATGSVVYALALFALMFGLSRLPGMLGVGLILVGLVGLGIFAWWETKAANPVLRLELLLANRPFALSSLAALINYSATSAVTFLLSLYLQYAKVLSPQAAGLVLIAQPVMMAAFSPLAGRLSDRIEPRIVSSIGMALSAAGLALLMSVSESTPLWAIVVRLMLLGFGFALFSSPNMNAIMSSVSRRDYGVASGIAATMRLVGQMLSMGVALLLFALHIGRVEITHDVVPQLLTSMKTAFAIFTVLCVAGVFASLARGRIREENDKERRTTAYPSPSDH